MPEDASPPRADDATPASADAASVPAASADAASADAASAGAASADAAGAGATFPDTWQPLPPAAVRVGGIVAALIAAPAAVPVTILIGGLLRMGPKGLWFGLAMLALCATIGALYGRARARRVRWRLDRRGLQVSRGIVWQGEVLVPRSRVQHIDIERGPIERRFGLASLVVHTAGTRLSALRQGGFPDADAVALRDALLPEAGDDDDL